MDILEQIRKDYNSFSKTRRRICDFILNEPERCCFCSLKNFALQTNTTEVTVLNFCRALGLDSYLDLKKALQDYVISKVNPGKRLKMAVSGSGNSQELQARIGRAEQNLLQSAFERNTPEMLLDFIHRLQAANHVYIAAHSFSLIPASYLSFRLTTLGVANTVLDTQDQRNLFLQLGCKPEGNVLVAIAIPPYGGVTLSIASYCKATGLPVLAISDRLDSPLAKDAAASLACHVDLLGTTNSCTPLIGLIDLLTMLYSFSLNGTPPSGETGFLAGKKYFDSFFLPPNE